MKKFTKTLLASFIIVGSILTILILVLVFYSPFPNAKEVEKYLSRITNPDSDKMSYIQTLELMDKLRYSQNVEQDRVIKSVLDSMRTQYMNTHDTNILKAIDDTPIYGGFANYVCSFYSEVLKDNVGRLRYINNPEPVRRCVGLSLSEAQFTSLVKEKIGTEHSPSL